MSRRRLLLFSLVTLSVLVFMFGYAIYRGLYESWGLAQYRITVHNNSDVTVSMCIEMKHSAPKSGDSSGHRLTSFAVYGDLKPGTAIEYSDGPGGGLDQMVLGVDGKPFKIESVSFLPCESGDFSKYFATRVKDEFRGQLVRMPEGESIFVVQRGSNGELELEIVDSGG